MLIGKCGRNGVDKQKTSLIRIRVDNTKAKSWDQSLVIPDSCGRHPLFFVGTLEYGHYHLDHIGEFAQLWIAQKGSVSG